MLFIPSTALLAGLLIATGSAPQNQATPQEPPQQELYGPVLPPDWDLSEQEQLETDPALWGRPPSPHARTTSVELIETPELMLGTTRRLIVQFHSIIEDWNPYLTRFGPGEYVGLVAWADEQLPWLHVDYDHPALVLFLPRRGELEQRLRTLRKHDRIELTIRTDELLLGRAWPCVTEIQPLRQAIPEGTVLHVIRARDLIRRKAYVMASDELERALAPPLPYVAREKLIELLTWCRGRLDPKKRPSMTIPIPQRR
ncbi:MAG: hypothetical protein ACI835_001034 [Planctomycetota bacterium]|jgi:hypothetical protein